MDLLELGFRPGHGVHEAIDSKFGLPVTSPADKDQWDFFLLASFGRCAFRLSEESVGYIFKQLWEEMRLILGRCSRVIECSHSLFLPSQWVFTFINSDPLNAKSTRFSFIFGAREEHSDEDGVSLTLLGVSNGSNSSVNQPQNVMPDLNEVAPENDMEIEEQHQEMQQNHQFLNDNEQPVPKLPDHIEPILPEEIQVENLLNLENIVMPNLNDVQAQQMAIQGNPDQGLPLEADENHLQVDAALKQITEGPDPGLKSFLNGQLDLNNNIKQNPDAIHLWAKHLDPTPHSAAIPIHANWADFFTKLLLSPSHFDWAKSVLQSKLWTLVTDSVNQPHIMFQLPSACPANVTIVCNNDDLPTSKGKSVLEEVNDSSSPEALPTLSASTSKAHAKKRKCNQPTPVVESEVRRSDRVKDRNKGYRSSACAHRDCFACSAEPPTLSKKVIKNLGVTLCKIPHQAMSDEALAKTAAQKKPIGPEKSKDDADDKANPSKSGSNEDKAPKKSKK
ncbi:hypothetical protein EJB05_14157, partial [Eragrostis curvula]